MDQLGERRGFLRVAVQRISDQLCQVLADERGKDHLSHHRSVSADGIDLAHQRMCGTHFVIAVGADQHQVTHIRLGQQIFEQIESSGIEPLQVVEKQGKRMFRPRENGDETTQRGVEAALRVLGWEIRDRRLFSY